MRERINGIGKPAEVRGRKSCRQNFRRDSRQARGSHQLLLLRTLCDYAAFGIMQFCPTQLEVCGESGERLFDFRAEGVLGFRAVGDFLEPIGMELPCTVGSLQKYYCRA